LLAGGWCSSASDFVNINKIIIGYGVCIFYMVRRSEIVINTRCISRAEGSLHCLKRV
jgi:hypothetical protein